MTTDTHASHVDSDTMPKRHVKYVSKYRQEHPVPPEICSKIVVFCATIVPCDKTKYYVQNEDTSYDTQLSNVLTPEEYVCLRDLLMKIVTKKDRNIDGNHTIEISHSVDH